MAELAHRAREFENALDSEAYAGETLMLMAAIEWLIEIRYPEEVATVVELKKPRP